MENLTISLVQTALFWEQPEKNRRHFEGLIRSIDRTDLIILPEMFTTGFSMKSKELAETMDGETISWLSKMVKSKRFAICGSLIIEENGNYFNRLIWMKPDGTCQFYDKRHLFRMADENSFFSAGQSKLIVELKGWKICPLICYDLRFPVWSRNKYKKDNESALEATYDLLIYIANWPEARVKAWEKLLFARSIENQCYLAAVNRIGNDGKEISYSGSSMLLDPKGVIVDKAKIHSEEIVTATLNKKELIDFRAKFPVGLDGDQFEIS